MSEPDAGLGSLSATLMEHIDRVCDRFERAWKAGERPRIEAFLDDEPEPGRSALLRELLVAELEWRLRLGERPERREYLDRLGAHASQIDSAFEVGADPDATPPHPSGGPGLAPCGESHRFRILRPHAEGGLGVIYLAHDGQLNREVALKEIRPGHADHPESRARFLLEAEINGGLEHPGIVPVYSLGRHPDGRPYYAMRFIQGTSLKDCTFRNFLTADRQKRREIRGSHALMPFPGGLVGTQKLTDPSKSRGNLRICV